MFQMCIFTDLEHPPSNRVNVRINQTNDTRKLPWYADFPQDDFPKFFTWNLLGENGGQTGRLARGKIEIETAADRKMLRRKTIFFLVAFPSRETWKIYFFHFFSPSIQSSIFPAFFSYTVAFPLSLISHLFFPSDVMWWNSGSVDIFGITQSFTGFIFLFHIWNRAAVKTGFL